MSKQILWVGLLSLAVTTLPTTSLAITVQDVSNPREAYGGWVTDQANILSPETETQINQLISELEAQNGSEIAVVTVPETAPAATPKEFTTKLFNHWKIGKAGKDNGVLFLISQGDRRVEIETGYGVEGVLPDARVGNLIQQEITPRFKQGDLDGGTLAGTKALVVILRGDAPPVSSETPEQTPVAINPALDEQNLDPAGSFPVGWVGGIGAGTALLVFVGYKLSRRPVYVEPEGRSRVTDWGFNRPLHCQVCQQPMLQLDSTLVLPHLSQPEQVAQNIGSLDFQGWQCPSCSPQLKGLGMHIRAYIQDSSRFHNCPHCLELTVERTIRTLSHPTEFSEGQRLITDKCHCCSYHKETQEWIPRLPPPPPPSSSSGGCSDGGGSFGGGSSGGGGAGGSW